MMKRVDDPITLIDKLGFGALIAMTAAVAVLDAATGVRFIAFELAPPAVHDAQAPIRFESSGGRQPTTRLLVESSHGWIALTTGPSTLLGTPRSGVDAKRVFPDTPASVAWIDAPARWPEQTAHYPIRVAQSGRVLLEIDGAAGVAREELANLAIEGGLFALACAVLTWRLLSLSRRDKLKMAAARDAWHRRHAR